MQTPSRQLLGSAVYSIEDGTNIAVVKGYVIAPAGLKIIAFALEHLQDREKYFLLPADIKLINKGKVYVNSAADISLFEDLVRHQEVISKNYSPLGSRVETDDGKKLGKVVEFSLEPEHCYISKLRVSPPILSRIMSTGLLIDRSNIINVLPGLIVVDSDKIRAKNTARGVQGQEI